MNTPQEEQVKLLPLNEIKTVKGEYIAVEVKRKKAKVKIVTLSKQDNDFIIPDKAKVIMVGDGIEAMKSNIKEGDIVMLSGLDSNILNHIPIYINSSETVTEEVNVNVQPLMPSPEVSFTNKKSVEFEIETGIALIPVYNVILVLNKL